MSTFGKKALVWWDYDDVDSKRFNHTPCDIQLKILEKWYPIGTKCKLKSIFDTSRFNKISTKVYSCEIKNYVMTNFGYRINIKFKTVNDVIQSKSVGPFGIELDPNFLTKIKREDKLGKLGF